VQEIDERSSLILQPLVLPRVVTVHVRFVHAFDSANILFGASVMALKAGAFPTTFASPGIIAGVRARGGGASA
jgi:hypothetical protein